MNSRQRHRLIDLNRSLIFGLTLGGLLMDGLQASDLPGTGSPLLWRWLPVRTRMELGLVRWASVRSRQLGPVVPHLQQRTTA
jgi:hypothetical protein